MNTSLRVRKASCTYAPLLRYRLPESLPLFLSFTWIRCERCDSGHILQHEPRHPFAVMTLARRFIDTAGTACQDLDPRNSSDGTCYKLIPFMDVSPNSPRFGASLQGYRRPRELCLLHDHHWARRICQLAFRIRGKHQTFVVSVTTCALRRADSPKTLHVPKQMRMTPQPVLLWI